MEIICVDTNLLIAHKRAKQKHTTRLYQLSTDYSLAATSITAYELYRGNNSAEDIFWSDFFAKIIMLDFTVAAAIEAGGIYKTLKSTGMMIDIEDILIAAIAISHHMKLATDNKIHLSRIDGLKII